MKIAPEFQNMWLLIGLFFIGIILGATALLGIQQEQEKERNAQPRGYYYNPFNRQYKGHVCRDTTHMNCDGMCECDGMECPRMRDYQIEVTQDGSFFYDGTRFVGFIPYSGKASIDSLINKDNQ